MDKFAYDDPDVTVELEVGEEEVNLTVEMSGELSVFKLELHPHDLESFMEFLSACAEACQVELHRQEMESLTWHAPVARRE